MNILQKRLEQLRGDLKITHKAIEQVTYGKHSWQEQGLKLDRLSEEQDNLESRIDEVKHIAFLLEYEL